ncbi:hypothetical protein CLOM_g2969 [Closterium sp. NIES-68]|nr:hypothetical protein CLOM_g2969 [Closterium sp. NIES-68]GJP73455.1 hypothetical protein CLOP_g4166 [Closterium sp. NIES-67]GJP78713.1 hypothetical protein CLOP_g8983 [Closterium sp. NIES-67]
MKPGSVLSRQPSAPLLNQARSKEEQSYRGATQQRKSNVVQAADRTSGYSEREYDIAKNLGRRILFLRASGVERNSLTSIDEDRSRQSTASHVSVSVSDVELLLLEGCDEAGPGRNSTSES